GDAPHGVRGRCGGRDRRGRAPAQARGKERNLHGASIGRRGGRVPTRGGRESPGCAPGTGVTNWRLDRGDSAADRGRQGAIMGKALAAALLAAVAALAAGCAPGAVAGAHGKRVVVVNPQGPGPVDAAALARRIAREDDASVSVMEVDVLSPEAVRAASQRIVAQRPALVIAPSADMVFGLRAETGTIPILFVTFTDPVQTSLVPDEQRPRGNVSGFTFHVAIGPKQLELLLR